MTDVARAALRSRLRDMSRRLVRSVALGLVYLAAAAAVFVVTQDRRVLVFGLGMVTTGLGLVAFMFLRDWRAVWSDLRDSSFTRETGIVTAEENYQYGVSYRLDVNGVRLRSPWSGRNKCPFLILRGATVDYTNHTKLVLAIVDEDGRYVYGPASSLVSDSRPVQ
jgi:hypothetical protein